MCTQPVTAYHEGPGQKITFTNKSDLSSKQITVPCGYCDECNKQKVAEIGILSAHEASLHENNIFLTLTYDDDTLPFRGSLYRPHIVKFIDSLRAKINRDHKRYQKANGLKLTPCPKIKYVYGAEYGTNSFRPHFHICIFGYRPDDAEPFKQKGQMDLYTSEILKKIWGKGHITFGDVNEKTAMYTSGHYMSRLSPAASKKYYKRSTVNGYEYQLTPEFGSRSQKLGLGWLEQFGKTDVFPTGKIISPNKNVTSMPRAYLRYLDEVDYDRYHDLKMERRQSMIDNPKTKEELLRQHKYNIVKSKQTKKSIL